MRYKTAFMGALAMMLGAIPQQASAQDSSIDAGLGLLPNESALTPAPTPTPMTRAVVIPQREPTTGASWATAQKTAKQVQGPAMVDGYPYYSMEGLFASVCNAPYQEAKRDCPNMSSVQALGAMQLLMYYGNLIGNDSVLVVVPKSKLGQLAGTNGDVKLNQMTRAFRAKNASSNTVARAH